MNDKFTNAFLIIMVVGFCGWMFNISTTKMTPEKIVAAVEFCEEKGFEADIGINGISGRPMAVDCFPAGTEAARLEGIEKRRAHDLKRLEIKKENERKNVENAE